MGKKIPKIKKTERREQREKQIVDGETTTGKEEVAAEVESVSIASLFYIFVHSASLKNSPENAHKPTCQCKFHVLITSSDLGFPVHAELGCI